MPSCQWEPGVRALWRPGWRTSTPSFAARRRGVPASITRRIGSSDDANLAVAGGAPVRIRTSNLLIRSQMLYPVELRARGRVIKRAVEGRQIRVASPVHLPGTPPNYRCGSFRIRCGDCRKFTVRKYKIGLLRGCGKGPEGGLSGLDRCNPRRRGSLRSEDFFRSPQIATSSLPLRQTPGCRNPTPRIPGSSNRRPEPVGCHCRPS